MLLCSVSIETRSPEANDAHALFGAPPPTDPKSKGSAGTVAVSTGFAAGAPVSAVGGRSEADQLQAHVSRDRFVAQFVACVSRVRSAERLVLVPLVVS